MKHSFTASVRFHRLLLIIAMLAILFPLGFSLLLSTVQFFSQNYWSFDWLIAIEWLALESFGIGLLIVVASIYRRYIRRTLWTLALMVLLLVISLMYAAMNQWIDQGIVQWQTLDLITTGGLIILFHVTLWVMSCYALLLLRELNQRKA
jgi:hypothetical protein